MLVRGGLVDLIYHKTLRLDIQVAEKAAPLGLITSDIDRIVLTLEKFHELWACILETGIALYLLNREIGVACIAPAVIAIRKLTKHIPFSRLMAIVCTIANSFVAKAIPKRQKRWNQSIQTRIAMTSSALKEIKSVKMMGLSGSISKILQQARIVELDTSKGFRMWVAFMNTVGKLVTVYFTTNLISTCSHRPAAPVWPICLLDLFVGSRVSHQDFNISSSFCGALDN